jgi:hypothetical protein
MQDRWKRPRLTDLEISKGLAKRLEISSASNVPDSVKES